MFLSLVMLPCDSHLRAEKRTKKKKKKNPNSQSFLSRHILLNDSLLLSVSWGFWSDTPLPLPRSLSCQKPSPQLFCISRRERSLCPPPSLCLYVPLANGTCGGCLLRTRLFVSYYFRPWPIGLRTQRENIDVVFFQTIRSRGTKSEKAIPLVTARIHRDVWDLLWFVRGH